MLQLSSSLFPIVTEQGLEPPFRRSKRGKFMLIDIQKTYKQISSTPTRGGKDQMTLEKKKKNQQQNLVLTQPKKVYKKDVDSYTSTPKRRSRKIK